MNCTGCGYCLPCPHGVSIPANFLQLNNLSIYRDRGAAEFFYFHILKEDQRASRCEECGQCEELCPQHIPIPAMLKEVVREFESARAELAGRPIGLILRASPLPDHAVDPPPAEGTEEVMHKKGATIGIARRINATSAEHIPWRGARGHEQAP